MLEAAGNGDEADYTLIVNKVMDAEFKIEAERCMEGLNDHYIAEEHLVNAMVESELNTKDISFTEIEAWIAQLKSQIGTIEEKNSTELTLVILDKKREFYTFRVLLICSK